MKAELQGTVGTLSIRRYAHWALDYGGALVEVAEAASGVSKYRGGWSLDAELEDSVGNALQELYEALERLGQRAGEEG